MQVVSLDRVDHPGRMLALVVEELDQTLQTRRARVSGQGTTTIGPDSGFGPPFSTWVPKVGELVGFMVTSVARPGTRRTVDERTNIIVQPWRDTSLGSTVASPAGR